MSVSLTGRVIDRKIFELVNPEGAPASVLRFIERHIESVEHLEILLLLSENEREWKAAEIYQKIQSSQASVEQRLRQLAGSGLLSQNAGAYRFEPTDKTMRATVAELAEVYKQRRVRIIEAIYSRKTDSVQSFADAFRFKKE